VAEALGRGGKLLRILIGGVDELGDRVAAVGLRLCDFGGNGKLHLRHAGGDHGRDDNANIHHAHSDKRPRIAAAG
jgi:hypothetical protein